MRLSVLALAAVAATVAIGSTSAPAQNIPPGNSGADQYAEGVPGADGNNSPGSGSGGTRGSGGGDDSGGLPQSVIDELQQSGQTGVAAAAALGSTSPGGASPSASARAQSPGSGPGDSEGSLAGDLADALLAESGDGMGAGLPILLGCVLIGSLLLAVRKRAQNGHDPSSS